MNKYKKLETKFGDFYTPLSHGYGPMSGEARIIELDVLRSGVRVFIKGSPLFVSANPTDQEMRDLMRFYNTGGVHKK